jgi:protein-S-isoprenylcysteine O-methyltransferase Ste14
VSALIICAAFALWALVHSFLAGREAKSWVRSRLGNVVSRWYRLFFNIFAVLSLAPVAWLAWQLPDRPLYSANGPARWLMVAVQALSLAAMALVVRSTGVARFLGFAQIMRSDRNEQLPDVDRPGSGQLNVRGLYRHVRHPLYLLGLVLIWLSPVMSANSLALGAAMSAYFWIGSVHEEKLLVDEFGERYRRYRRAVPRIIPLPGRTYESEADGEGELNRQSG